MRLKILSLFLIVFLAACNTTETINEFYTTGTVVLVKQANPFWGIKGDDGSKYEPLSIPVTFQVDNKRVIIRYQERNDMQSPHNWGQVIELTSINENYN